MSNQTEYRKQKAKWYKKLKASGFKDIEQTEDMLIAYSYNFYTKNRDHLKLNSKIEYYRLASHFLNDYKFTSNRDKVIWEYHANGISYRNIAKLLKKVRIRNFGRTMVYKVVKRLREELIKKYMVKV